MSALTVTMERVTVALSVVETSMRNVMALTNAVELALAAHVFDKKGHK